MTQSWMRPQRHAKRPHSAARRIPLRGRFPTRVGPLLCAARAPDTRREERESKTVQREYGELSSDKQQTGSAVVLHHPVNAA